MDEAGRVMDSMIHIQSVVVYSRIMVPVYGRVTTYLSKTLIVLVVRGPGESDEGVIMNRFSSNLTQKKSQGASQAMLYATGLTTEDMKKAQVRHPMSSHTSSSSTNSSSTRSSSSKAAAGAAAALVAAAWCEP